MKNNTEQSLKSLNLKWLVGLALFDVIVVLLFVVPEIINTATISQLTIARVFGTTVLPVVVLLLTGLLPHDMKAVLVYWRTRDVLPGCQAFSKHSPDDARINMAALKKNVGVLPTEPAEQNTKWFKLYKMVANDPTVVEVHKMYLLYRDMAAMSLPLIVLVPLALYFVGASTAALWIAAGLFVLQFIATVLGARHSGVRFVCNVLAIHSATKVISPS